MTYRVTKTIRGRRYIYEQRSWREGKRVRTESRYIGPVDGSAESVPSETKRRGLIAFLAAQQLFSEDRALATAERHAAKIDKYQREQFGETAAERAEREHIEHLAQLYSAYGLTVSDPKVAEAVKAAADKPSSAAEAKESPSIDEGRGSDSAATGDAAETDGAQNS